MLRAESAAAFVSRRLREMSPPAVVPFLAPDVALVPVPRSSLQKGGALWPAFEIAQSLHAQGFGSRAQAAGHEEHVRSRPARQGCRQPEPVVADSGLARWTTAAGEPYSGAYTGTWTGTKQ